MNRLFGLLFLSLLLISACKSRPSNDCKFNPPEALFESTHPEVKSQNFNLEGMRSVEQVSFNNPIQLELLQDGCETVEQEFRFTVQNQESKTDDFWILQTIDCFKYITNASEKLGDRGIQLVSALQAIQSQIKIGQRLELAPGFYIKVDRIVSGTECILIANFSEGV